MVLSDSDSDDEFHESSPTEESDKDVIALCHLFSEVEIEQDAQIRLA